MVHSAWRYLIVLLWANSGMASTNECLIGFSLQGTDPFASTDWEGLSVCNNDIAEATVSAVRCSSYYSYSCFWSVVDCGTSSDSDTCTCQACGGMPSDLDEYMIEEAIWDRVRCAVYAQELHGYDVTPCVEALVDTMSMPGIVEEWTPPAVVTTDCITIDFGSYHDYEACAYVGTHRSSTEAFDYNTTSRISAEECLIGFSLQGIDPFASTDWEGLSVCNNDIAEATVSAVRCSSYYSYSCFWSVVDCAPSTDSDTCTCQACGGMPSDLDEYMIEEAIWDRVRCAVYAQELHGYDVTPCVEALVDTMSMPGIVEEWTPPAVVTTDCVAIDFGSYYSYEACAYVGTPRSSTEAFESGDATTPITPAPAAGVAPVTAPSDVSVEVTTAPAPEVAATSAPEVVGSDPDLESRTPAPEVAATSAPEVVGSDPDLESRTPAPEVGNTESGLPPLTTPSPSAPPPTAAPALEEDGPSDGAVASGEGASEEDSSMSAEIAIGIVSVVLTFLGAVSGVLWGSASTVYFNCRCCENSGSGPVVTVGARAPSAKWLPFRMASTAPVVSDTPKFEMPVGPGTMVPSVTSGLEAIAWTPVAAGTGMTLALTVDGRAYVFKSCASSTVGDGKRIIVGDIKRARAVEGEIVGLVVDVVTVNDFCELAVNYPSNGQFRVLRRCAAHVSSPVTYAVVDTTMGCILVVR